MTINPQCLEVLKAAAVGVSIFDAPDATEARARYAASTDVFAPPAPSLKSVQNRMIGGPGGNLRIRIYTPEGDDEPLPALLFFHGGGWVVGDLNTHDAMCRILTEGARCITIAVDYRMGPEHKFPAALEDASAALTWVRNNAETLGTNSARIAVAGDSAGGNLSAALALANRDRNGPKLCFQLLIYPATDMTATSGSRVEHGEGTNLTTDAMDWFEERYLRTPEDRNDFRASPLLAEDHSGLPPALIQTAEYDPLRDEGKAYADKLTAAGVHADYVCYPGMIHGFARMGALVDMGLDALHDGAAALRAAFKA